MLDGAALGTLMIGLESISKEADWSEPTVHRATRRSRPKRSTYRCRMAFALRLAADRLDRSTSASLGSSGSAA